MKFPSAKGLVMPLMLGFLPLILLVSCFDKPFLTFRPAFNYAQPVLLLVECYLIWMIFDTRYLITNTELKYHQALLKGTIKIADIHQLVVNKTSFVGLKPALAQNGIIVKFNRWDEIYVSPKDKEGFINKLKEINPGIEIVH